MRSLLFTFAIGLMTMNNSLKTEIVLDESHYRIVVSAPSGVEVNVNEVAAPTKGLAPWFAKIEVEDVGGNIISCKSQPYASASMSSKLVFADDANFHEVGNVWRSELFEIAALFTGFMGCDGTHRDSSKWARFRLVVDAPIKETAERVQTDWLPITRIIRSGF